MKKFVIKAVIVLIIIIYPLFSILHLLSVKAKGVPERSEADKTADLAAVSALGDENAADIEKHIEEKKAERQQKAKADELKKQMKNNVELIKQQVSEGKTSYRQMLSGTVIAGDSLMHSLYEYDILDKSLLVTKVSANLNHLRNNIDTIVQLNPKILVLHYGLNNMSTNDKEIDNYINVYTSLIKQLKEKLPNTQIVISSVFEVSEEKAIGRFSNVAHFNDRMRKMAKDCGCVFLDNKELLKSDKSYYETDGMHLKKKFYTEKYLPNLIAELGFYWRIA